MLYKKKPLKIKINTSNFEDFLDEPIYLLFRKKVSTINERSNKDE